MTPGIELTPQDAERLRQILGAYEAKNPQRMKEFDLANPPVPPYRFQEFPKAMFNHETGEHKQVKSIQEQAAALDAGWSTESVLQPEPEIPLELSPEERAEIADIDAKAKKNSKTAKAA